MTRPKRTTLAALAMALLIGHGIDDRRVTGAEDLRPVLT
jgi:hypothetical protein